MSSFTFGPFTLDTSKERLFREGLEVRMRPQALHVLRALLENRGRSLDYQQLMAAAWRGTFVESHTVDVTVGEVRKVLGEHGAWVVHRRQVGYSLEVPSSDELVRKGWHFFGRRTKEGAERATGFFQEALAQCPGDFHALDMFEHRPHAAEREFLEVLRDKPAAATAYVRMALMYATLQDLDRALHSVEEGYRADPLLPTLPSTNVNVRIWRREYDHAIDIGRDAVDLHPFLVISRANYAQALEFAGRLEEALVQYQLGSLLSGDLPWMRALEGTCLAKLDRPQEARAILDELEHRRAADYCDALYMAVLLVALGARDDALDEVERAVEENSAFLHSIDVDPKMRPFLQEPRFTRVREALRAKWVD